MGGGGRGQSIKEEKSFESENFGHFGVQTNMKTFLGDRLFETKPFNSKKPF